MKYYYIHPFKPQYFFPKGFKKYNLFLNFFSPYTKIGTFSWLLFKTFSFYRFLFSISNIEKFIPEFTIRKIIGYNAIMAFNKGSIGPEQKITALGILHQKPFFLKYGQTKIAKFNITNEYNILKQISNLDTIPKVLDFYSDNNQVLLKTNVFKGERLKNIQIDKYIVDQLILISKQKVDCIKITSSDLQTTFTHGDFCPWNLMSENGKILIYDWEMAGIYTLGFDLFTFIFQTHFLLDSEINISKAIDVNITAIDYYFTHFSISDWELYLKAYAEEKLSLEKLKGDKGMIGKYSKLLDYANKA